MFGTVKEKPILYIVIPCYNEEEVLPITAPEFSAKIEELIQLEKISTESKILFVDDGSKDNTETILRQFAEKDPRIKVISQENAGVSAARNRGLTECKGEFICFVDSDDTIEPDYLKTLLAIKSSNNNDLSICNFTRDMSLISASAPKEQTWQKKGYECAEKILCDKSFHPQVWCMLFRKEIIQKHRIDFTLGCTRGEDWEFFMKYLVHCNNVGYSDKKLYHYRINENSAMASFNEKSLTSLEAAQRVTDYYDSCKSPVKETIKQYAVSRSIWKFLILSLLQHNKTIYRILKTKYDTKREMRKLYSFPGFIEKITSRLFVFSEPLFRFCFYLYGYYKKKH